MILLVLCIIILFIYVWSCQSEGNYELPRRYLKYEMSEIKTFRDFCFPKKYELQQPQKFLGDFMRPENVKDRKQKALLVYHRIGGGKTCVGIRIGIEWKNPLYVMPASLIPGFYDECRSPCSGKNFMKQSERASLAKLTPGTKEYKEELTRINDKISKRFTVMSYNAFVENTPKKKHPIIILDESHTVSNTEGAFFKSIMSYIKKYSPVVVAMSATPIFDNIGDLDCIFQMFGIDAPENIRPADIPRLMDGYVSYYRGAPKFTYPKVNMRLVKIQMSKHQARLYKKQASKDITTSENDAVYIKTRQMANSVAPDGDVKKYSCKMNWFMNHMDHRPNSLLFVYCSFTEFGGVEMVAEHLEMLGYKDYFVDGPGRHRYVKWTGDTSKYHKSLIKTVFNSEANDDGDHIQVIIGSPAIKEGVSLFRLDEVHVLETYWNFSRLEQIYGRGIRYCSHKRLPKKYRKVNLYLYAAITERMPVGKYTPMESIDMYMYQIAEKKQQKALPYIKKLQKCAVDNVLY
jgi:hypothetical protein